MDLSKDEYYSVDSKYVVAVGVDKKILGLKKYGEKELDPINILKVTNVALQYSLMLNNEFIKIINEIK